MRGELRIWEDKKAVLSIIEGSLRAEDAYRIVEGLRKANDDPTLLTFNFPVDVIHLDGTCEFVGLEVTPATREEHPA